MLKERCGITYLCPQGEKSGTRGSDAAARCSNHRLLSSRTSPDDSLAFTHLRPSDHFAASVFSSLLVPRTYLSTLGLNVWVFYFIFFVLLLVVLGDLSCKNNPANGTRRAGGGTWRLPEKKNTIQGSTALKSQQAAAFTHPGPISAIRAIALQQAGPTRSFALAAAEGSWWKEKKKTEAAFVII